MTDVFISIGSNLGDRVINLVNGLQAIAIHQNILLREASSIYETEPVGFLQQPSFMNMACSVETDLQPHQLLQVLQRIEDNLGRIKAQHWGPRTIDLDLLLYGNLVYDNPELTIPHPRLPERRFVLVPLAEIAPHFVPPYEEALSITDLLIKCPDKSDVKKLIDKKKLWN
jgi:2-amino-4-hydroxy-6-hydroxymethyldihydropteridine diphosphokinase